MVSLKRKKPAAPQPPMRRLAAPRVMTMPLTEVFEKRRTSRDFSDETVSDEDLAAVLWAADGINRKDGAARRPQR